MHYYGVVQVLQNSEKSAVYLEELGNKYTEISQEEKVRMQIHEEVFGDGEASAKFWSEKQIKDKKLLLQ